MKDFAFWVNDNCTIAIMSEEQFNAFMTHRKENKAVIYKRIGRDFLFAHNEIKYGNDTFYYDMGLLEMAESLFMSFRKTVKYYLPSKYFPLCLKDSGVYILIAPYRIVDYDIDDVKLKVMEGYDDNKKRKRGKGKKTNVRRQAEMPNELRYN